MPTITILPDNITVEALKGESLLETSLRTGIPHAHACGGKGICSTCRVMVSESASELPKRNEAESRIASTLGFGSDLRLACQMHPRDSLTVRRLVLDQEDIALIGTEAGPHPGMAGEEKMPAIMFADLRGFTSFSEALPPYDVIHLLQRYFARMEPIIRRHHGVVYNHMGDGLMAIFDLSSQLCSVESAIHAGLEMLQEFDEFKSYLLTAYGRSLDIGVGVHIGPAVIGSIGFGNERRITAIGDAVNTASRIESANKETGTRFLISQQVHDLVGEFCVVGQAPVVTIRGKAGQYQLYEVMGVRRC